MRWIDTAAGRLRIHDSGGNRPALLWIPDGPCVIEHHLPTARQLAADFRVIVADLPGFGFSAPPANYRHRLEEGAQVLLAVLDALNIPRAILAASCVNGYYAIAAAHLAPTRVAHLLLMQTPALDAMHRWTERIVPKPIRIPILGQLLSFVRRRSIAHGWYAVALAQREQRDTFRQTAEHALAAGGCYCFASVVQGMRHADPQASLLQAPSVPATLLWGDADRSHRGSDPQSLLRHLPHAQIERCAEAGHFPDLEAPDHFVALVRRVAAIAPALA